VGELTRRTDLLTADVADFADEKQLMVRHVLSAPSASSAVSIQGFSILKGAK
jgi:hypothetical protein